MGAKYNKTENIKKKSAISANLDLNVINIFTIELLMHKAQWGGGVSWVVLCVLIGWEDEWPAL